MMAWAFETVGVTSSNVKGSAVKSNAVLFHGVSSSIHSPLIVLRSVLTRAGPLFFDPAQMIYGNGTRRAFALPSLSAIGKERTSHPD